MTSVYTVVGTFGMLCILIAFVQEQRGAWKRTQLRYDVINLIGSAALVSYGWYGRVWPFVILNSVWAVYSLRDVITDFRRL